ncbi:hypothetical protein BGX21_011251 [Mortierella sp. AD011]|nr:hypothetical protein BGX20_008654 [Mortierella sp. AD010]KAF9391394.1 hypothetical protein BGX21_011251 [Mortierella sp. AD011]
MDGIGLLTFVDQVFDNVTTCQRNVGRVCNGLESRHPLEEILRRNDVGPKRGQRIYMNGVGGGSSVDFDEF